jgi:hypothetical protein
MTARTTLSHLLDDELLRHAENVRDPLTSTDVEIELCNRLAAAMQAADSNNPVLDIVQNLGFDLGNTKDVERFEAALEFGNDFNPKVYRPMLDLLAKNDTYDLAALQKLIDLNAKITELANDAGDIFTRLTAIIATTQE